MRLPRRCSSAASASAVPATAYWRPVALWLTISTGSFAEQGRRCRRRRGRRPRAGTGDVPSAPRGTCACIASPRRCTSVSASSSVSAPSACSAENSPTLWPAAVMSSPTAPSARELGELRGGERDERRLRELGAEQDAARVADHAPVIRAAARAGCARRRRAGRTRAPRSCARRRAPISRVRPASARAPRRRALGAGCPGPGRRTRSAAGRRSPRPSATSVSPARTRTWITRRPPTTAIRVASKSRIAPSATGARNVTRHSRSSVASPPQSASTTNADARAAVHAP